EQLLQDLKTLRSLLDYVFRYDAITFYQLLLGEKSKAAAVRDPPLWIGTSAADRSVAVASAVVVVLFLPLLLLLFGDVEYEVKLVLEENAKWRLAADVMKEIRDLHAARQR
ncbi:unnamed protein product, partial [Ectocarpus fasciculatus]